MDYSETSPGVNDSSISKQTVVIRGKDGSFLIKDAASGPLIMGLQKKRRRASNIQLPPPGVPIRLEAMPPSAR